MPPAAESPATPPAPAPSAIPSHNSTNSTQNQAPDPTHSDSTSSDHPTPLLRFQIRDLSHPAAQLFLSAVDISSLLSYAVRTASHLLYPPSSSSSASPRWPELRSVTLVLAPMGGVAFTKGIQLDDAHKEIHLSLSYIADVARRSTSTTSDNPAAPTPTILSAGAPARSTSRYSLAHELTGVLVHEAVHTLQHNGRGAAPGGLIEGVADWVRLRAGLAPAHWKRRADGRWDAGYDTTGYFLEWLETVRLGKGTVPKLNALLREKEYDEGWFWGAVSGEEGVGVEQLWEEYARWVGEEQ